MLYTMMTFFTFITPPAPNQRLKQDYKPKLRKGAGGRLTKKISLEIYIIIL